LQDKYTFPNLALSRCSINLIAKNMSSYHQHLYHIVFRTKDGKPAIKPENSGQLYAYITGLIKNKGSFLYRINGVENHIHILTDMNPSIAPVDFVKDIKVSSSIWIKGSGLFPGFYGWSVGYGSFTCSYKDMEYLIEYIKNQREHHRKKTFEEEFRMLLNEYGIRIDERFFP